MYILFHKKQKEFVNDKSSFLDKKVCFSCNWKILHNKNGKGVVLMLFLSWDTVYNDKKRLIKLFEREYGIEPIEMYSEETEQEVFYLGYRFKKDGKRIVIKVPFVKDEADRFAAHPNKWEMLVDEKVTGTYKNVKEAFRVLQKDENAS